VVSLSGDGMVCQDAVQGPRKNLPPLLASLASLASLAVKPPPPGFPGTASEAQILPDPNQLVVRQEASPRWACILSCFDRHVDLGFTFATRLWVLDSIPNPTQCPYHPNNPNIVNPLTRPKRLWISPMMSW
jgi:hypothetical protein